MFYSEICAALESNDQVKLSGFGNFELRDKKAARAETPKPVKKSDFCTQSRHV